MSPSATNSGLYAEHFHLNGEPFSAAPSPGALYPSPQHAEARAALEIGLRQRSGLLVLTGEPGTGKTSLMYSVLSDLEAAVETAYVANTSVTFDDLLREILSDFGITPAGGRALLLRQLNDLLRRSAEAGRLVAVVIDEAQNLSEQALESVRLLSNFETFDSKLLQIVLVGQPELDAKLATPQLRQLANRIAVRIHLVPLTAAEGERYIEHRLRLVGGSSTLFSAAARRTLLRHARGIPRRINILCQTALLFAYGEGAAQVTWSLARRTVRKLATLGHQRTAEVAPAATSRRRSTMEWLSVALVAVAVAAMVFLAIGGRRHRETVATSTTTRVARSAAPFETTLEVDTGALTALPRLSIETSESANRSLTQSWAPILLTAITIALAAGSVGILIRLRRMRGSVWSLA